MCIVLIQPPRAARPPATHRRGAFGASGAVAALAIATLAGPVSAQPMPREDSVPRQAAPLATVTVTATRTSTQTFAVPQPVSVLDSAAMRDRLVATPVDLFRHLPGLDVTGVGSNQTRPQIRGQRGQRILLLEDALRLNNSRRQQDFGELPALAGLTSLDRVEVVRGPSSVLYGTDALGGVVNLISTELPALGSDGDVRGHLGYRYGSAGDQRLASGGIQGRFGRAAFRAGGGYREAGSYLAPSGSFGRISLSDPTRVNETGVRDRSLDAALGWDFTSRQRVFARAKRYHARGAGFGYVDPARLGPNQPLIDIGYPDQTYSRYLLGYRGTALRSPFADRAEVTVYAQRNERDLAMHVWVPFGQPGAGMDSRSRNYTDLGTVGFRAEAAKLAFGRHLVTYGVDFFRDRSENTDSSLTMIVGFGPPQSTVSTIPLVPNARFRSAGAFAQGELRPIERLTLILGARVQDIAAETRETPGVTRPGVDSHDRTAVGAANVLYRLRDDLNLIGSVARGFRSPNLVERFFEGATPEGTGYQRANPDLSPETSVNVDVGLRYRRGALFAEAFAFRNTIRDGIRIEATGDSVNHTPAYRNVNVDELRHSGVELLAGVRLPASIDASASYTKLDARSISDPNSPVGESYGDKLTADVAFRPASGRLMLGYSIRRNGEQKEALIGTSPIGTTLPAFTLHSVRGRVFLFDRGGLRNTLGFTVENLTNELYAEFANAGFFRPEPRRSLNVSWLTEF